METYQATLSIQNMEELIAFARKIQEMPECDSLTSDEKLKIIFSYPIKIQAS